MYVCCIRDTSVVSPPQFSVSETRCKRPEGEDTRRSKSLEEDRVRPLVCNLAAVITRRNFSPRIFLVSPLLSTQPICAEMADSHAIEFCSAKCRSRIAAASDPKNGLDLSEIGRPG
jgi:hypothetical protein